MTPAIVSCSNAFTMLYFHRRYQIKRFDLIDEAASSIVLEIDSVLNFRLDRLERRIIQLNWNNRHCQRRRRTSRKRLGNVRERIG